MLNYLDAFLPVDPKEASEDMDGRVASVPALWGHILDSLGHRQPLKPVPTVDFFSLTHLRVTALSSKLSVH